MENNQLLPQPKPRDIKLSAQVNQETMGNISQAIISINKSDERIKAVYKALDIGMEYNPKPINIYIDSYGGAVYQAMGLLSVMDDSSTPIHTYVTGCAMSCGFLILIHGHKRFAYKHSTPMYHQVSSSVWGKSKDIEDELIEVKRLQNKIESMVIDKTNITKEKLKDNYNKKKDWFFTPNQAKKWGIVDELIK